MMEIEMMGGVEMMMMEMMRGMEMLCCGGAAGV